jgi:hypothetical protein
MKKYVFTMKEDVCEAHGKDAAKQSELLAVMAHYGTVEDYERVIAPVQAEYQGVVDNLTAQLTAIKEQELTVDEIKIVKAYRENKTSVVSEYIAEADKYKSQLEAVKNENEQRVAKLKAILGD